MQAIELLNKESTWREARWNTTVTKSSAMVAWLTSMPVHRRVHSGEKFKKSLCAPAKFIERIEQGNVCGRSREGWTEEVEVEDEAREVCS